MITFTTYQKKAKKTLIKNNNTLTRMVLGLCGESGEIAEKFKKFLRGDNVLNKKEISREIGDVLWYLAVLCELLKLDFSEIAEENLKKLKDRQGRNKIKGKGDNR